jgi:hypothetical protein
MLTIGLVCGILKCLYKGGIYIYVDLLLIVD